MGKSVDGGSLLLSKFRDEVVKNKLNKMDEATEDVMYPTGFLPFDYMNGYTVNTITRNGDVFTYNNIGIMDGSINMVIGRSGCGKTTFCVQAGANIIRPFESGGALYMDAIEGGDNKVRRCILTGFSPQEIEKKMIYRNANITAENFYQRINMIYEIKMSHRDEFEYDTGLINEDGDPIIKFIPTVYILDSLALLSPDKLSEEEELSGQMSATSTARVNTSVFKRIIPKCKGANIIIFVINHINQKVEINPFAHTKGQIGFLKQGETLPGGNAALYVSNNMIRLDDGTKLKATEGFGVDGFLVDYGMVKSRSNQTGKTVQMVYTYDHGFDQILSLFSFCKAIGAIEMKGAYVVIPGYDGKVTQKTFKEKVLTDPDFAQAFYDVCKPALMSLLANNEEEKMAELFTASNNLIAQMIK